MKLTFATEVEAEGDLDQSLSVGIRQQMSNKKVRCVLRAPYLNLNLFYFHYPRWRPTAVDNFFLWPIGAEIKREIAAFRRRQPIFNEVV
jgi:hypothetical protein